MMRIQIILALSLFPILSSSQHTICVYNHYEVWDKDTINMTVQGVKQGPWIVYDIAVRSTSCFSDESCPLEVSIRHINAEGIYIDGRKIGQWKYYYTSGTTRKLQQFSDKGLKTGTTKEYYKDGALKSQQIWENGTLMNQIAFYPNGNLNYESFYEDNRIHSFVIYWQSGEVKYTANILNEDKLEDIRYYKKNGNESSTRYKFLGELLSNEGLTEYL